MKITDCTQVVEDGTYANVGAYIVDLMAAIQAVGIFLTVEELLMNRVLSIIPRDCKDRFGGRQLQGNLLGKLHKCS